jgi:hypothetical protein
MKDDVFEYFRMLGQERFWRQYISNLIGGKGTLERERNSGHLECAGSHSMGQQTINNRSSYGALDNF